MKELITVRTFSSSIDFEMVKAYLESCEIECFGQDEVMNRAYLSNANGGIKLQVKPDQLEDAIRLLHDGGYLKKEDLEPSTEIKWLDKILCKLRGDKND